ncbi:hypothetical protein CALCODRAFT_302402 [Calocera cornea HHB12733]|uniref:Uncharacterized protein n=1 Tax=Calocera cornea HHB12733 TaxID=1353952 RepID=A0A165FIY4_9BASI|nr:hypothetical protein CALCODRAFT_302402 [Calocera cornea HHB12733]
MVSPAESMGYSALFTAGLANCATPRAALDHPLPPTPRFNLADRRRTPPPTPLIIPPLPPVPVLPARGLTTMPARATHSHFAAGRKSARGSVSRRRSIARSPQAALKSPGWKEARRELHVRRARDRESGENWAGAVAGGGRKDEGTGRLWTAPVTAFTRLRQRTLPLTGPSPPPSKPLPALPPSAFLEPVTHSRSPSPSARSLKGVLTHLASLGGRGERERKPLSPIDIPPPMKSFFLMDEGEDEGIVV